MLKTGRMDCISNYAVDNTLESNGEKVEPDVLESLKKVASYTLIVVLLCSY